MTSTIEAVEQVLKTDEVGRVRTPAERREQLLAEFERSGLSGSKFATLVGVKYSTFAGWVSRRRKQAGGASIAVKPADSVRWLQGVVEQAQGPGEQSGVVLQLPGGARLQITQASQAMLAAALLRALEKPC
jgi:transposase-like protein